MTSKVIKFVVNGEAFLITNDILSKYPNSMLYASASFSEQSQLDSKNNTIEVELPNRDNKIFRYIKSYMETGVPIFPHDNVEKELLIRELKAFGLDDYLRIIENVRTTEELSQEIN